MVDRLLASDDHAEHVADVYLDLLVGRDARARPRLSRETPAGRPISVVHGGTRIPGVL